MIKSMSCFSQQYRLAFILIFFGSLTAASAAHAADTLAYSFETFQSGGLDGFQPNGGGSFTSDTIGATDSGHSLKVDLGVADTFVGALTTVINPAPGSAVIGDPPGIDHVLFDLTIDSGQEFTGGFSVIGVTVFGMNQAGAFGFQRQYRDIEHVEGKAAGTYHDLRIDLTDSEGSHETFNQTFGVQGSGSPLIPTGFEFFFNKSSDAPMTVYIDNVRVGGTAGVPGDYNGNGVVDAADYALWRKGGPLVNEVDTPGTVNAADYTAWRARFGNVSGSGSGSGLGNASVPEPGGAVVLLIAGAFWCLQKRR